MTTLKQQHHKPTCFRAHLKTRCIIPPLFLHCQCILKSLLLHSVPSVLNQVFKKSFVAIVFLSSVQQDLSWQYDFLLLECVLYLCRYLCRSNKSCNSTITCILMIYSIAGANHLDGVLSDTRPVFPPLT